MVESLADAAFNAILQRAQAGASGTELVSIVLGFVRHWQAGVDGPADRQLISAVLRTLADRLDEEMQRQSLTSVQMDLDAPARAARIAALGAQQGGGQ